MNTFYRNIENYYENNGYAEETVFLIEDDDDRLFGSLNNERWKDSKHFYGSHDNFIFMFSDHDQAEVRYSEKHFLLEKPSREDGMDHTFVNEDLYAYLENED